MSTKTELKVCSRVLKVFARYELPPRDAIVVLVTLTTAVICMLTKNHEKRIKLADLIARTIKDDLPK